jgi:hypothetical protein
VIRPALEFSQAVCARAELLGDHGHGERHGEIRNELDAAAIDERRDELLGELADSRLHSRDSARPAADNRATVPPMFPLPMKPIVDIVRAYGRRGPLASASG